MSALNRVGTTDLIGTYFQNFENLSKFERWREIISQGTIALEAAKKANRFQDEAKICAQLSSAAYYLGEYSQALIYSNRCHELSQGFVEPSLLIQALYLKSAVHRALAAKCGEVHARKASYRHAVEIGEEAASIYSKKDVKDINLKGKVYF